MAFIAFARRFFEHLASDEYGLALGELDASSKRWTKRSLQAALNAATGGARVTSANGLEQSAKPVVEELLEGEYRLRHRLPIDGKWANVQAVFLFRQKPDSGYFHVDLLAIEKTAG